MESYGRFAGTVVKLGPEFGFISLDDSTTEVWFHRDVCEEIQFENIQVGDRLHFSVKESVEHPGQLAAGRLTREKYDGPKFHAPKPHVKKNRQTRASWKQLRNEARLEQN